MAIPTEKPSYGPLDGVKVVYAAVELACPKAADLMADWGADVVWLENTGAGDTIRDTAYVKQAERRNQRSVALNRARQASITQEITEIVGGAEGV